MTTAIDLANRYAELASKVTPTNSGDFFKVKSSIFSFKITDSSIANSNKESEAALSIIATALRRQEPDDIVKKKGSGVSTGGGMDDHSNYISGRFEKIPLHQLKEGIKKIQRELSNGWEKDNEGNYVNTSSFADKSLSPYIMRTVLGNNYSKLIINDNEQAIGVLLTAKEVDAAARLIGFRSPVRQK